MPDPVFKLFMVAEKLVLLIAVRDTVIPILYAVYLDLKQDRVSLIHRDQIIKDIGATISSDKRVNEAIRNAEDIIRVRLS